jgi:hypothetical protein
MQLDPPPAKDPSPQPSPLDSASFLLNRPVRRSGSSAGAHTNKSASSLPPSPPSRYQEFHPPIPSIPDEILPPTPPFNAVILTAFANKPADLSQTIISVETATETHRTTLATLTSRPSHLSRYLLSLVPERSNSDALPESPSSPHFSALFRDSTTLAALASQSTTPHVFLDRPSAP